MRIFFKRTLRALLLLLMMSCIAVLSFVLCLDNSAIVTKYLFPLATKYTPLSVKAGTFRLSPKGEVETTGFELSSPSTQLSLKEASLKIDIRKLLHSRLNLIVLENLSVNGAKIEVAAPSKSAEREEAPSSPESATRSMQLDIRNAEIHQGEFSHSSSGRSLVVSNIELSAKKLSYPGNAELRGQATLTMRAPHENFDFTTRASFSSLGELERMGVRSLDGTFDFSNFKGHVGSIDLADRTLGVRAQGSISPAGIDLTSVALTSSAPHSGTLSLNGSALYHAAQGESSVTIASLAINSPFVRSFFRSPLLDALEFTAEIQGKGKSIGTKEQQGEVEITFPRLTLRDGREYEASALKATYHKNNSGWKVENARIDLRSETRLISDLSFSAISPEKSPLQIAFESTLLDSDQIQSIATALTHRGETNTEEKEDSPSPLKSFPELQVKGSVSKFRVAGTELQNLLVEAASTSSRVSLAKVSASSGQGLLTLDGTLQNDGTLEGNARVIGLTLESLIEELPLTEKKIGLAGTINGAHLSFHGTDIFNPGFENRLTASLQSNFSDLRLPSRFQDVPPINIVFLPFSVFSKIIGTLGSAILPAELSAAGGEFKSTLGEQGRLYIKKGVFDMKLENGVVTLPSMELNTNLLPTVQYEGTIGLNRKVDLVSRIKIAEVLVPLPIGGTLDAPLPDVAAFIPEVIKSLGLSVTGIFGRLIPALDPRNEQSPRDLDTYLDSLKKELPAPQAPPNSKESEGEER